MEPQPDTCDCVVNYNSSFIAFDKKENCFDSLLLNENADELSIQEISEDYIKIFRSWGKSPFQSVFVDVGIIQVSNRFSILRLKRRVKYRIEMLIYYKPYEKKEY